MKRLPIEKMDGMYVVLVEGEDQYNMVAKYGSNVFKYKKHAEDAAKHVVSMRKS